MHARTPAAGCVLLGVLLGAGCASSIKTRPVRLDGQDNPAVKGRQGVLYALPRTVVVARVPLLKSTHTQGEFFDLLPYFFADEKQADHADKTRYKLDKAEISTRGEADPGAVFLVDVKGGLFEDKKLGLVMSDDAVPDRFEAEATDRSLEIAGQVIKSAAGVAAQFIGGAAGLSRDVEAPKGKEATTTSPTCPDLTLSDDDQEFLKELPKPFQRPFCLFAKDKLKDAPSCAKGSLCNGAVGRDKFLRAVRVIQSIEQLQQTRTSVVTKALDNRASAEVFKAATEDLDAQIRALQQRFFGSDSVTRWDATFEVRPSAGTQSLTVQLYRYLDAKGACAEPAEPAVVALVPPPAVVDCTSEKPNIVSLVVKPVVEATPATAAQTIGRPTGATGLFYRVPGRATVEVTHAADEATAATRARASVAVAQFGTVLSLPHTTGGRKTQYTVEFHPASGALKNFKVGSEAGLDPAFIATLGDAATGVIAARQKRDAAREAEADELARLKREREILEEKLKIKEAENKLKTAAGQNP